MYRDPSPPAPLLVISFGGHVLGVHRRSGEEVWRWALGSAASARVVVGGEHVVAVQNDLVACLSYTTGDLAWRAFLPFNADTVMVDGNEIFVAGAGEAAAYDLRNGAALWHAPFKGMGLGSVALALPGNAAQVDRNNN